MQRAENKGSAVKTVCLIKCLFVREPNNGTSSVEQVTQYTIVRFRYLSKRLDNFSPGLMNISNRG